MAFNLFNTPGSKERRKEGLQGPGQAAQEEGGRRRWQGQEEEVVQGKVQGQAQQPGSLRQGRFWFSNSLLSDNLT